MGSVFTFCPILCVMCSQKKKMAYALGGRLLTYSCAAHSSVWDLWCDQRESRERCTFLLSLVRFQRGSLFLCGGHFSGWNCKFWLHHMRCCQAQVPLQLQTFTGWTLRWIFTAAVCSPAWCEHFCLNNFSPMCFIYATAERRLQREESFLILAKDTALLGTNSFHNEEGRKAWESFNCKLAT